jgi:thiamine-monophosphate kinase
MAARPVAALVAVALSNSLTMDAAVDLLRGIRDCGRTYGCPIVGGDTNSWDAPTVISITVAARAGRGGLMRRHGAQVGDLVCITGPLGGSILGRHLDFAPRLDVAEHIAQRLNPHAMMDISDGLALDLSRMLDLAGCGAALDSAALDGAIHADAHRLAAQDGRPARAHALYDGEDFELLVALPPDAAADSITELGLSVVGRFVSEPGLWLNEGGKREPLPVGGWEHFR